MIPTAKIYEKKEIHMNKTILAGLLMAVSVSVGTFLSPLFAQQETANPIPITCYVGDSSNAACSGKWILFAGNTSGVDSGAWALRMNSETGEIWYKNGKKLVLLSEPD